MFEFYNLIVNLGGVAIALVVIYVTYFKWAFTYWKKRNVPIPFEPSIPFGHGKNPLKTTTLSGERLKDLYNDMKVKGHKYFGLYFLTRPMFVPIDLDLVKNIMTKDFSHFTDRGIYSNEKDDPITAHLFSIGGNKWRNLRAKLTPTFTSGKMKMMFPTLVECGESLKNVMADLNAKQEPIDIKEILGCFSTDIIGSCAFGLDCKTFDEKDSLFRKYGKKVFEFSRRRQILVTIATNFPKFSKNVLHLKISDPETTDFFTDVVRKALEYREKNNYVRKDFLQILIDLNKQVALQEGHHDGKSLTFNEMVAQSFVFFLAGFETSSTTMSFALFELSINQEIQDKVRKEVNDVLDRHNGEITYESIHEMKYMDTVLNETMRKYAAVPIITRQCVKDYPIPSTDVVIEKGTRIVIPVMGIHYDKEYYPDPEKFIPERFTEENIRSRNQYTHLPFGEGPRVCIGMRFGLMQSKVGLAICLKEYKFTVNNKTPLPLKLAQNRFIPVAEGGIWLSTEKI